MSQTQTVRLLEGWDKFEEVKKLLTEKGAAQRLMQSLVGYSDMLSSLVQSRSTAED